MKIFEMRILCKLMILMRLAEIKNTHLNVGASIYEMWFGLSFTALQF